MTILPSPNGMTAAKHAEIKTSCLFEYENGQKKSSRLHGDQIFCKINSISKC